VERGNYPNRSTNKLMPGRWIWLTIAAISLAIAVLVHFLFNHVSADALVAKPGMEKAFQNTDNVARSFPLNFDVPASFQGKTIKDAPLPGTEKLIALTFDDGPWPETTEKILKTLKEENIKATFFVIGQPLISFPEIGKKVLADGHVIANHTMHHWYHKMGDVVAKREIDDTAKIIKNILGVETEYFRPPGGVLNNGLVSYSESKKQSVLLWSVDTGDSRPRRPSPEQMIKTTLAQATPGGIVLMHDGGGSHDNTAKALPGMIKALRSQGYQFVTVSDLLSSAAAKPDPAPKGTATPPNSLPDAPIAPKG
jgi:peptidoglycan-N-acetylglucosamine deacetylase